MLSLEGDDYELYKLMGLVSGRSTMEKINSPEAMSATPSKTIKPSNPLVTTGIGLTGIPFGNAMYNAYRGDLPRAQGNILSGMIGMGNPLLGLLSNQFDLATSALDSARENISFRDAFISNNPKTAKFLDMETNTFNDNLDRLIERLNSNSNSGGNSGGDGSPPERGTTERANRGGSE